MGLTYGLGSRAPCSSTLYHHPRRPHRLRKTGFHTACFSRRCAHTTLGPTTTAFHCHMESLALSMPAPHPPSALNAYSLLLYHQLNQPGIKTRFCNHTPHLVLTTRVTRNPYNRSWPTQSPGKMVSLWSSNSRPSRGNSAHAACVILVSHNLHVHSLVWLKHEPASFKQWVGHV